MRNGDLSFNTRPAKNRLRGKTFYPGIFLLALAVCFSSGVLVGSEAMLEERRNLLNAVTMGSEVAQPRLIAALGSEYPEVRRTAAHLAVGLGAGAGNFYAEALRGSDSAVRYVVVNGLADSGMIDRYWLMVLLDDDPAVQRLLKIDVVNRHPLPTGPRLDVLVREIEDAYADADAVRKVQLLGALTALPQLPARGREFVLEATTDENVRVREAAYRVLLVFLTNDWPDVAGILQRAAMDPSANVVKMGRDLYWVALEVDQIRMPVDGWRFAVDPKDEGRRDGWYQVGFDDSGWRTDVPGEASWQEFMDGDLYMGAAWYRCVFDAPRLQPGQRAWIHFGGADEEAWVWLNGTYVGSHEEGTRGWDVPFAFDITDELNSGAANQLTVRVRNTAGGGGLWAPVRLRITDAPSAE